MDISLRLTRYFRSLECFAALIGIVLIILLSLALQWTGFSRVFGMIFGIIFLPVALLELFAFLAERFRPDARVSISILIVTVVWTLILIVPLWFVIPVVRMQFRYLPASSALWHLFPDSYDKIAGGSVMVICLWLVPIGIVSGIVGVLRRRREEEIRASLLLWQISFLAVIIWGASFQWSLHSRFVDVAGGYLNPIAFGTWINASQGAGTILSFTVVLFFWSLLFVALRYSVKFHGTIGTMIGLGISLIAATGVIFVPPIPYIIPLRYILVNDYGYYFKLAGLLPLRIWVGSILLMGGTLCVGGLSSLFLKEKRNTTT